MTTSHRPELLAACILWIGTLCALPAAQAATPCESPTCAQYTDLTAPEGPCAGGAPCSVSFNTTICSSPPVGTDCEITPGEPGTTSIGMASWYSYTTGPEECGIFRIDACDGDFDGVVAVYDGGPTCQCPLDESAPLACGDDTCGFAGGMPMLSFLAAPARCYLIKVGGWQGDAGTGVLSISIEQPCEAVFAPPMADDHIDVTGAAASCGDDDGCPGESVCRGGFCYVPRQRFLSVRPNPLQAGVQAALRVSIDAREGGVVPIGWVSAPQARVVTGPGPAVFQMSAVVDAPHYRDWTTLDPAIITIGDCEISPGQTYHVQGIAEGFDTSDESRYSAALTLPTPAYFGDVTSGGQVNHPPEGARANIIDIFAVALGFQNIQGAPKDWLDIGSTQSLSTPDLVVTLSDVQAIVLGFKGMAYPGPAPDECP